MKLETYLELVLTWIVLFAYSCGDSLTPVIMKEAEIEVEIPIPDADSTLSNAACPDTLSPLYLEKDGVVLIEMESAYVDGSDWKLDTILSLYSEKGYLFWEGNNNFNSPGKGLLNFRIRINKEGTYRFSWRSRIGIGTSSSEHNDSWLRIPDAKHFYAKNDKGNILYPRGSSQEPLPESSGQNNTSPNGSSSKGWFKVYMNNPGGWTWRAATSDHDPHGIFAVFDEAGDYTVQISGRSKGHAIDKFVLFLESIPYNTATVFTPVSRAICH